MEHPLVAVLLVSIAVVTGSILHDSDVPYPQLIPIELAYSNAHSPVVLPQHLGLSLEALSAAYISSPAPVYETSVSEINAISPTNEEESVAVQSNEAAPELTSKTEDTAASTESGVIPGIALQISQQSPLPTPASTDLGKQSSASSSATPELSLLTGEVALPTLEPSSELPSPSASPETNPALNPAVPSVESVSTLSDKGETSGKLLDSITRGAFYIDADGKLQMQATITSNNDAVPLQIVAAEEPESAVAVAVPAVVPEIPVVATAKATKSNGVANVNVNVNVNVNGDGAGSNNNATSQILASIEKIEKKH